MFDQILKAIPTDMDYQGQKKAEKLFQYILIVFGIVGFAWGYMCQEFSQTVYILGAGFALSGLLTLPPWPMYRSHPLKWQKPREESSAAGDTPKASNTTSKKRK